tara:strand:+ start:19101 stop:19451 length:351 start_codon:yes stop_codon:yes gene_type:complete
MLSNKIHLLKNNLIEKITSKLEKQILSDLEKDKKIEYLEKKLSYFEEQIKTQNALNATILNNIEMNMKEKEKISKDIQIIVAALKDVYTLIENNLGNEDFIADMLLKKNKKNDTYH